MTLRISSLNVHCSYSNPKLVLFINLYKLFVLYVCWVYCYPSATAFYIFNQQIYLLNFLRHTEQFPHPKQNAMYIILIFFVHRIFTFYIQYNLKVQICLQKVNKSQLFCSLYYSCYVYRT
jgi:hypothetical protein